MGKRIVFIISMLLAVLSVDNASAANSRLFTAGRQGLSSTYVNHVLQDGRGFVWIATRGGLDRYDGVRFVSWHKGALPSDNVTSLAEDADGRLVAGTVRGAAVYDHTSGSFMSVAMILEGDTLNAHVTSLLRLAGGDMLITTTGRGLFRLPCGSLTARHIDVAFDGIGSLRYSALAADGTVWLAGSDGVFALDSENRVKSYLTDGDVGDCCIAATNAGQVFVGTTGKGLFVYDAQGDRFVQQPSSEGLNIVSVRPLADGTVLVGTNDSGAWMLRRGETAMQPCAFHHPQVDLRSVNVHCMMQDRDGTLWMGLFQKGLLMQPLQMGGAFRQIGASQPDADIIGQHCVLSVFADADGTVWVGTDGDGLYHIDIQNNRLIRHYPAGQKGMPATIMAIAASSDRLWVGSWQQGGGWIDRTTGEFHRLPLAEVGGAANVMGLAVDSRNRLWISTGGNGLACHDMATGKTTDCTKGGDGNKDNALPNLWPSQLAFSADGRLMYITMSQGLACYDLQRQSYVSQFGEHCVLRKMTVNTVCTDIEGDLWVGTDDGLFHLDQRGNIVQQYTTADGLPHNNVASLQFDNKGQLWIGTMNGLSCKRGETFSNYYASDGLQEGEWSERTACLVGNLVVMGGVGGLSVIDPSAVGMTKSITPHIQLVSAVLDQQPVPLVDSFELHHGVGSLSLRFSAMVYDRPESVVYLYSINGADFTPLQSSDGVLTLSNLASGTYTVSVKAVVGGVESEPVELTVDVLPPFYASWTAIAIYIIICVLSAWGIVILRRNRSRQQQALQQHIQAERMKEDKLQFFMSLNHEIRTPMTLIAAPLQQLIANDHDEVRQRLYGMMNNASQRILTIINQILDLRKIDRGLLEMRMRPVNIVAMVRDVCALFEAKAAEHRITLFVDDRTNCEVWIDPAHFDKVIMNLLSNAFKFTPDGGNVGVTINRTDTECIITVWDDGQSIAPENLNRVFERFFQEDNTVNRATAGTGIGLNLARQLVQLHHGTIEAQNLNPKAPPQPSFRGQSLPNFGIGEGVEDTPQTGCAFVITLPLGDAHLDESEKYKEVPESSVEGNLPTPSPCGEGRGGASKRPTVLVVEDEEDIRNYLTSELSGTYNIVPCADGREALSEALRCPPALVLSDVMMPNMDGYTLCARLKSNTATNFVPVILLTAKTRESDKLEGLGQGADAYIEKPFNIDIVRHTIRNLIAAHDLLRNKLSGNELPLDRIDEVRIATPDEQLIDRITRVVNAHIDDPNLSVEQIAQEVGISRAHLHRKMKELTNLGPRDWVRNLRLQRAAQMLRQGHHNISQVMYACGFDNQSSFTNKFKTQFGMSPTTYMKEHSEKAT